MIYNQVEYYEIGAAIRQLGVGRVMVGYRNQAPEIEYITENSDAKCLIFDHDFVDRIMPHRGRYENLLDKGFICIGPTNQVGAVDYEQLIQNPPDVDLESLPEISGQIMIYTSGTTGRPKGATRGVGENRQAGYGLKVIEGFGYAEGEVHLVSCPLYHSAPFLFSMVARILGGTIVLMKRFDAKVFLENIDRYKVTSAFVVPTILDTILQIPEEEIKHLDLSSLRSLICGGAPLFPKVKLGILDRFGPILYEFYGSTETSVNTILTPAEMRQRPTSVGRAFADNELIILDEKGKEVPAGESGVLYIYNSMLMEQYYKDEQATKDVFHGKYMTVGDVAVKDKDGFYYIIDRVKDMIIRGGVNIYPAEIEEVLHRMPGIMDVAVLGKPDDHWGEIVAAFIVPETGAEISEESIKAYCADQMAGYKIPELIFFRDEIPRNPTGKILKKDLRSELVSLI
jgi:fatty-acyl-CoA synthase